MAGFIVVDAVSNWTSLAIEEDFSLFSVPFSTIPAFFIDCPDYALNTIPRCSPRKPDLEHSGSEGVSHVGTDCVIVLYLSLIHI